MKWEGAIKKKCFIVLQFKKLKKSLLRKPKNYLENTIRCYCLDTLQYWLYILNMPKFWTQNQMFCRNFKIKNIKKKNKLVFKFLLQKSAKFTSKLKKFKLLIDKDSKNSLRKT
jgi:hypothetical protein